MALESLAAHPAQELAELLAWLGAPESRPATDAAQVQLAHLRSRGASAAQPEDARVMDLCRNASLLSRVVDFLEDDIYALIRQLAQSTRSVPSSYILRRPSRCPEP